MASTIRRSGYSYATIHHHTEPKINPAGSDHRFTSSDFLHQRVASRDTRDRAGRQQPFPTCYSVAYGDLSMCS